MGGFLRAGVGLLAIAFSVFGFVGSAAAQTYTVTGNTYSVNPTLASSDAWDSHELVAPVGKNVAFTARTTGSGCILVIFALGHAFDENSYYLPAYSQETWVSSFSDSYTVPSGGGPDFSLVITTEVLVDVPYHLDITITTPNPIVNALIGIGVLVVIIAVVAGISMAMRKRRRARAPYPQAPPMYQEPMPPGYQQPMAPAPPVEQGPQYPPPGSQ